MFYIGTNLQLLDKCCKRKVKINFSLYKICLKHIKKEKNIRSYRGISSQFFEWMTLFNVSW